MTKNTSFKIYFLKTVIKKYQTHTNQIKTSNPNIICIHPKKKKKLYFISLKFTVLRNIFYFILLIKGIIIILF